MSHANWSAVASIANAAHDFILEANDKLVELGKLFSKGNVLELGCGAGLLVPSIAPKLTAGRYIGVDVSPQMLAQAKERTTHFANVRFHEHDAHQLRFADGVFDVIYGRMVLPSFDDPKTVLQRCRSVLRPGGRIALLELGGAEHNELFRVVGQAAPALELGHRGRLIHLLEGVGFEEVATRPVRGLVTIEDPRSFWTVARSLFGIESEQMPEEIARLRSGTQLTLEIVFALGRVPEAGAPARIEVHSAEQMVGRARRRIQELSPHEVKRRFGGEVSFLDVREIEERASGCIKGSVSLPRGELEQRIADLITNPAANLVTYSQLGDRGALAAARLVSMGYRNVYNLLGGFEAWKSYQMPWAAGEQ